MTTRTYSVPGISCEHCRTAIESEVSGVDGIRSVEVDLERRTVTVAAERLDEPAVLAAIVEAGYEVAS